MSSRTDVQRNGVLHTRAISAGGPFYTFACPHCGVKLLVEVDGFGKLRLSESKDLTSRPRLRRLLDFFLGPPASKRQATRKSVRQRITDPKLTSPKRTLPKAERESSRSRAIDGAELLPPADRDLATRLSNRPCLTIADARREYRRFVKENHPDRFTNRSVAERETAERRFQQVHSEFQRLMKRIESRSSERA